MSKAVTTSRVNCPLCGESATLTVETAFGTGNESSSIALSCRNGCQPDDSDLASPLVAREPPEGGLPASGSRLD
jgi:hypothetical protein